MKNIQVSKKTLVELSEGKIKFDPTKKIKLGRWKIKRDLAKLQEV